MTKVYDFSRCRIPHALRTISRQAEDIAHSLNTQEQHIAHLEHSVNEICDAVARFGGDLESQRRQLEDVLSNHQIRRDAEATGSVEDLISARNRISGVKRDG